MRSRSCSPRTEEQCRRSIEEHDKLLDRNRRRAQPVLSGPERARRRSTTHHDHFGFRDRLSQPVMKVQEEPTPGSARPARAGEFILGYPDEDGSIPNLPQPEVLSRNGSYMAYRRLEEHVTLFREYVRQRVGFAGSRGTHSAAKFMGRWRSGAPLVLAPDRRRSRARRGSPAQQRFQLSRRWTPSATPAPWGRTRAGSTPRHRALHEPAADDPARRHLLVRPLPDDAPDDGADRGIAAFIICADLVRQFEFAQNVWINDKTFHELGNEHDPICGTQDGTLDFTVPRSGRYVRYTRGFQPSPHFGVVRISSCRACRDCAIWPPVKERRPHDRCPHLQPDAHSPPSRRAPPDQHLLDLELPLGSPTRSGGHGEPVLHHDRSPQRAVGRHTRRPNTMPPPSCRASPARWSCSTVRRWPSRNWQVRSPGIRWPCSSGSIRPATGSPSTSGFSMTATP